ncbi:hypothetical protein [Dokdonella sp.]|uniref:hypothetical protein n=1 Tax=Dokdonella sp. TaxID=2291710 RepID=UPI0026342367|nr:hypothetical protein [Dokdonella sp.]
MHTLNRLTLALAVGIASNASFAAENTVPLSPADVATHQAAVEAHAERLAQRAGIPMAFPAASGSPKAVTASARPGTPHANGFRAYPPSCAAVPLPDTPSGPLLTQTRIPLFARNPSTGQSVAETVTLTIWRIACSSSGELTPYNGDRGANAMTLMRIQRDASANPNFYITYPLIHVSQQGSAFDGDASLLRAAIEPNTVISDTPFSAPLSGGTTFVLENYPYVGSRQFFYNYAFALRVDPVLDGVQPRILEIPGYQPTPSTYPDSAKPRPFDGYAAAQWVGKTRPGDGLLMQVTEQWSGQGPSATWSRQIVFDLLTRDTNGDPFWLIGSAPFDEGAIRVDADVYYLGANNAQTRWGKAVFSFNHCNRLEMNLSPNAGLSAPVPVFSGVNQFDRLFSANGMVCE